METELPPNEIMIQVASPKRVGRLSAAVLKYVYLSYAVGSSLKEERMDLWGEYDEVTDTEFINIVLPAALGKARWRILDLRRSHITIQSVTALCASGLLKAPRSPLTELCLGSTNLKDEGLTLLAQALKGSKNLRALSVFDNGITDEGVSAFCSIIDSTAIQSLNLSNNNISDIGASTIASVLGKASCKLQRLLLNVNDISDKGANVLLSKFAISGLSYLGLHGNQEVSEPTMLKLASLLEVANSNWYQVAIGLIGARQHPRVGAKSSIHCLPIELVRQVCELVRDSSAIPAETSSTLDLLRRPMSLAFSSEPTQTEASLELGVTSDLSDDEDDSDFPLSIEEREEINEYREDALASLAHQRRLQYFRQKYRKSKKVRLASSCEDREPGLRRKAARYLPAVQLE